MKIRRVSSLFATILLGGCCTFAQPSVFGVPPRLVEGSEARLERPLPVPDREELRRFIAGCALDGATLCDTDVSHLSCVLDSIAAPTASFKDIAACKGARVVEVYDARAKSVYRGFEIARWIFAQDSNGDLIVFHGYFPQEAK